jgi:hypothetical protein
VTYTVDAARRLVTVAHVAEITPALDIAKRVFISYSHADRQWLAELRKFMCQLEDLHGVEIWDDTAVRTGDDWFDEIEQSLRRACVGVFLVTQDFVGSRFIRHHELPVLLESAARGGCVIFWIAVRPSTVTHTPLGRFQAANDPEHPLSTLKRPQREKVFVEIFERLNRALG